MEYDYHFKLYDFGLLTFMQVVTGFAPLHRRLEHRGDYSLCALACTFRAGV